MFVKTSCKCPPNGLRTAAQWVTIVLTCQLIATRYGMCAPEREREKVEAEYETVHLFEREKLVQLLYMQLLLHSHSCLNGIHSELCEPLLVSRERERERLVWQLLPRIALQT